MSWEVHVDWRNQTCLVGRWSLSPAYDINPVPEIDRVHTWKTPISEEPGEPTIGGALAVASRFGLNGPEAMAILREVLAAVSNWRQTAARLRLKAPTLAPYATAFEHALIQEARKLVRGNL